MERILETAKEAALGSGALLLEWFDKRTEMDVSRKGPRDYVTEADLASQEYITGLIRKRYPDHSILAEEGYDPESIPRNKTTWNWIIDPLDGTVNFLHGIPVFTVSIAVARGGETCIAVVYQPTTGEMFTAIKEDGAFLNGKRIQTSLRSEVYESVLATGFPYNRNETEINNLDHFNNFFPQVRGIRRMGTAALDLGWVAAGRFDGFWELHLNPWDVAAGSLLVREAGGLVTDFSGGNDFLYSGRIVASNGLIHKKMLRVLKQGRS